MRTTSLGLSIFGSATALARRLGRELQTFGIMLIRRLWVQHAAVEKGHQAKLLARCAVGTMVCNCTVSSSAAAN